MACLAERIQQLRAELEAINLWDHLYVEMEEPSKIEGDACATRLFRRCQIAVELNKLTAMN
jgi:hypothetical protein